MAALSGALNFKPGGNPFLGAGGGLAGLGLDYGNAYQSALQSNQQNYNNILGGYQQNYGQLQQGLGAVGDFYGGLQSGISHTLGADYGVPGVNNQWGIAAPAAEAINRLYTAQTGQQFDDSGNPTGTPTGGSNMQSLISRGMGNTTALESVNRASTRDYATATGSLGANLAQTYAGYQANIGEAYAGQQNAANLALANQGNQQLGFENSVSIPYPNAGLYSSLYAQQGQASQAAAAQAQQLQIFKAGLGRGGAGAGGGGGASIAARPRGGTFGSGSGGFPSGGGVAPDIFGNNSQSSGNVNPNGPNSVGGNRYSPPVVNTNSTVPGNPNDPFGGNTGDENMLGEGSDYGTAVASNGGGFGDMAGHFGFAGMASPWA